jgi:hypothetical protein
LLQIDQLQSVTSSCAGATTSNLTRPQWQPPLCLIIVAYPDPSVRVEIDVQRPSYY